MAEQAPLQDRLLCNGSYQFLLTASTSRSWGIGNRRTAGHLIWMRHPKILFYGSITAILYRQWVADGKKLSQEEVIALATELICNRMSSVVPY